MYRSSYILILCIKAFIFYSCSTVQQKPKKEVSTSIFKQKNSIVTGSNFSNNLKETKKENIFIYDNLYAGSGVGLGDINNDGYLDVYIVNTPVNFDLTNQFIDHENKYDDPFSILYGANDKLFKNNIIEQIH